MKRALTIAAQHTRNSYRWPAVRLSKSTHAGSPTMSSAGEGKTRLRFVRTDESSGVKVGRLSSGREGLVNGMLTASGPRKMTFSTLAETRAVAAERRRMRERERMPRGGAMVTIERQAVNPRKRSSLL